MKSYSIPGALIRRPQRGRTRFARGPVGECDRVMGSVSFLTSKKFSARSDHCSVPVRAVLPMFSTFRSRRLRAQVDRQIIPMLIMLLTFLGQSLRDDEVEFHGELIRERRRDGQ